MKRHGLRQGLTLLELVVVIAVLAVLAGFLMPRLVFVRGMALQAGAGTHLQDVAKNISIFHATQGIWPHRFDSLLESDGTLYNGTLNGLEGALANVLEPVPLTTTPNGGELRSLLRFLGNPGPGGSTTCLVLDHDETETVAGNSGRIPRELVGATGAGLRLARVRRTGDPADSGAVSGA